MKAYRFRNERMYRRRRSLLLVVLIVCIAGALFVYFSNKNKDNSGALISPTPTQTSTPDSTPVAVINPSSPPTPTPTPTPTPSPVTSAGTTTEDHGFLPDIGSLPQSDKTEGLKKLVEDFVSQQSGKYGVTFIDLATGESFGIKDTDEYIAASTSKFPINLLLYTKIESGEIDPEMKLEYKKSDFEAGTGIIQGSPYGTQYTVRETSKLAIQKSDNCGVNMIIDLLGLENCRQYIVDLGGVVYYGDRHRSCPHDMALVAKELYRHYLENPEVYGEMINNLENTDWHDRIDSLLPKDVKVAHKIGNQTRTANDVGIVFASHPYVLSVMTDNVDFGTACTQIGKLSKMIYYYVEEYAANTAK